MALRGMNSLLLWIGGLLVAVLAALFAVPHVIDWDAYRGVFEEEASRVLGRDVRVGGKVNLRLLPSPYVRFEKVRISDAGAALGEPFFRTEAFTLWLSPTPLLKGAIEASEIELDRPVLRLAVDQDGRGNWQAIKIAPGALPFMPSDVILQQVRIRDGIVSLRTPGFAEPLTLSSIDGELAASSLDGPYRFRGMLDWQGSRREIRIGTSQRETDGKLRYKASVRSPDNGNVYSVDGLLSELSPRARNTGTLTAKLPLASVFGGLMPGEARARPQRGAETIDLTATIDSNLESAQLSNLAFAFEQDGKPQLVNGEMVANWRNGLRLETRLTSRWLDLDQIVGPEGARKASPMDTVRRLIGQASLLLPRDGTSLVTFDVDQVNLGGDALSGVKLALARAGGLTSIGEFRAALPGGARGELRGTLGSSATKAAAPPAANAPAAPLSDTFEGEIVLRGTGYQRFAAWVGADGLFAASADKDPQGRPDAPFSISSRLRLDPEGVILSDAQIEIGGSQVLASADWRWGASPKLDISAEAHKIDIAPIAPGSLDFTSRPGAAAANPAQRFAETGSIPLMRIAERVAGIERAVGSLRLKLKAQELADGQTTLRDVDADLAVKAGTLTLTNAAATSPSGARIELQGELSGLRTKPAGTLRGWTSAAGREAMTSLLEALPAGARGAVRPLLEDVLRTDLGFTLVLGGVQPDLVTLSANGTVDGSRAVMALKLDGGLAQWREAPFNFALDIDGVEAARPLRLLAGRHPGVAAPAGIPESAALRVRAAGGTIRAIITTARIETGSGTSADYDGNAALTTDGTLELKGAIRITAPAASELLVLAGASRRLPGAGNSINGVIDIERNAAATTLSTRGLDIGGGRVGGKIAMTRRGERTRIDGQLTTDRLSIPGLMGMMLDGNAAPAVEATAADAASPWPDTGFVQGLVGDVEGQITIGAASAALTPDLGLTQAEARIAFGPGRIELQGLTGAALGGRFTARGTIEAAQAGAGVSLEARMTGAQLAQFAPGGSGTLAASGEGNAVFSITSRGFTPRAIMATAVGKGEIEIRNGRVPGIAAEIVDKAAIAAIEGSDAIERAQLEKLILAERPRSQSQIGNVKLPVEIADGAARIGALEIKQPEASLRNSTTIDLAQLRADSEWQIVSRRQLPGAGKSAGAKREPLPPLVLVWTGALGSIAKSEPRLSVDRLERELSILKMERDAERLEELRRQDEERVRLEQERQRRLEAPVSEGATPAAGGPASNPTSAPVIQAPFQIPQNVAPQPAVTPQPRGEAEAPMPRVVRPPAATARQRDQKSLQDLLMGQRP